jgi:hypothetical protein
MGDLLFNTTEEGERRAPLNNTPVILRALDTGTNRLHAEDDIVS